MKKLTFFTLLFFFTVTLFAQTATAPAGSGTSSSPYLITSQAELYWLTQNPSSWDKYFEQRGHINLHATEWDDDKGLTPIGNETTPFTGQYDGLSGVITNVFINRPDEDYIGFFGKINNATIKRVNLNDVNIKGNKYVGGLVGYTDGASVITQSRTRGKVDGGGSNSKSVGGLVGELRGTTNLNNSYSLATVNSDNKVEVFVGGLVGLLYSGSISNCYAAGAITRGTSSYTLNAGNTGGLVGARSGSTPPVTNSFYDTQAGYGRSSGGIGKTTAEMKNMCTYFDGTQASWDFDDEIRNGTEDIWGMRSITFNGYPFIMTSVLTHTATCCVTPHDVSDIAFGNAETSSINLNRYTSNGGDGYAIYINNTNSFTAPNNGTTPTADNSWNNSGQQCIYFGHLVSPYVNTTGLSSGTDYFFKIYSYSDCEGTETYNNGTSATSATTAAVTTTTARVSGSIKYSLDGRSFKTMKVVDGYIKKGRDGDVVYLANYNLAKGVIKTSILLKINLNVPYKPGTHTFAPKGKCKAIFTQGRVVKSIDKAEGSIVFNRSNGTVKIKSGMVSINGSFSGVKMKK